MHKKGSLERARELVGQMTAEEAAGQLIFYPQAVERLGVPSYVWWNEALHGVARAGIATVFPQAIGLAALFDETIIHRVAEVIATEGRAKYNMAAAQNDRGIYKGLTFWSPNINIFRDPRWGRGQETYGEDPYLTSRLGVRFITGLQGTGETMKAAACAKHYAVHSGPEGLRHEFNAIASPKDMEETYLPAFEAAVREAKVEAVMGAYNRTNGEPCCGSKVLMVDILRGKWGFNGHYVSDCWALEDFHKHHKVTENELESAALAISMGCDMNCGSVYTSLLGALREGLITEEQIFRAAERVFATRFKLGMFDDDCEYNSIPYTIVHQPAHLELALSTAEKSMVLLQNNGILPLSRERIKTIGVIGPNAYSVRALHGNYYGESDNWVTNVDGVRLAAGNDIRVMYSAGADIVNSKVRRLEKPDHLHSEALAVAMCSDVVVLCLGLDATIEGEQGDTGNTDASGDKTDLLLPEPQRVLCDKVLSVGKPVIIVINSGSALDLSAYEGKAAAIIQSWYSGERGGEALGHILFGDVSPSGRLPLTFYYNDAEIPDFTDYSMRGRTYKFVSQKPWYPFGFGRSYTRFVYSDMSAAADNESITLKFSLENAGDMNADEVVQVYWRYEGEAFEKPRCALCGFKRVSLPARGKEIVSLTIPIQHINSVSEDGSRSLPDGRYTLYAGGCQPEARSIELGMTPPLHQELVVKQGQVSVVTNTMSDTDCILVYSKLGR